MEDQDFMRQALALAGEAAAMGEVPVGCVIVRGGKIVGRGRNCREERKSALAHAEIAAIQEACRTLGGWRLWDCTLYVTLEPCPMCAGAILHARIPRVVYAAKDEKGGACGSVCDLFAMDFNHHPKVEAGLLEAESAALLQDFFRQLRLTLRGRPRWRRPEG
ncbi:MAG TPA: nucleoside deaminase [Candidatus Faecousia intestinigallinarum]|nr:nucleoside deaminase [Candidatus Faecousia intestinigallinarum]